MLAKPARERFLAGVPADVVLHVRRVVRGVFAEAAEEQVAVQLLRVAPPDARHAPRPRHHGLT